MSANDDAMRLLEELAELGMDVARRLHEAAMAAEDTKEMIALTEAFCDAGRGMRQSIALLMRIRSGSFAVQRAAPQAADHDADTDPDDAEAAFEREEPPERGDWYERPDYDTPLRLTGDPAHDEPAIQRAVATAVTRIRRTYAKAEAALAPKPEPRTRAALLTSSAPLRLVDSS